MSAEAPDFAAFVGLHQAEIVRDKKEREQRLLVEAQGKYDENKAVLDQFGICEQFRSAANTINEQTGRAAHVVTSPRPKLDKDEIYGSIEIVKGSPTCEVALEWEPVGTWGITYLIKVRAENGEMFISAADPNNRRVAKERKFGVVGLDQELVNKALVEAYQNPLFK